MTGPRVYYTDFSGGKLVVPISQSVLKIKGISEIATVPATPAILNALYDALGKRFYSIPVKPEKIVRLLNG